ncbi:MAG: FAD:protein FMN transferase [Pseudomonadota bacterium]|nr:MAG: FAD:protein FMN transferase [Pseudomonadota bacterium]
MTELRVERVADYWVARFQAMASPCEVLVDTDDPTVARRVGAIAYSEALRVERKFSRYRADGVVAQINAANGATVEVDEETAALLNYADACYRMSDGRFDVTSGILRRVWRFDGSARVPESQAVQALMPLIGWGRVSWQNPRLTLLPGMEIDLGGIGKEYAVDRAVGLIRAESPASVLVNFGGDLVSSGARRDGRAWQIGIENPAQLANANASRGGFELTRGAAATSGDTRRYLLKDGQRYPHILDARTGWPVEGAPKSITVLAPTCIEAGTLATLAMLQGVQAESFLDTQGVKYWCLR